MMISTGGDGDVATRRLFHIVLAAFGLSLLLIPLDSVYSSTVDVGGVGFEARVGFGDRFRPGTWVPVWINVTNAGIPFDAYIEVITTAGNPYSSRQTRVVYRRSVRLPSGTHKQFTFNIPLTNTAVPIDIRLVELNGNILSNRRISLRESAMTSDIVLVLDTSGEQWTWLHEIVPTARSLTPQTRVYVAHARAETDLPAEWVAYESVRTVILTPSFPIASLAPEQITALVDWVEAGGHLLVAGGPGLDLAPVRDLADKLPVSLSNTSAVVTLKEMGYNVSPLPDPTQVLASVARSVRGKVDLAVDDIPLIAHSQVGTGRITYLGFDLGAAPLRTWEAFDYFSRSLVFPPRMIRRSTGSLEQRFLPLVSAQKIPYPRHLWLLIFFLAYGSGIAGGLRLSTKHPAGWLVLAATVGVGTLYTHAVIDPQSAKSMRAYAEVRVSLVDSVSNQASSAVFAGLVNMHGGDWVFARDADMHIAPAGQSSYGAPQLMVIEHTDAESRLGPAPPRQQLAITAQMIEEIPVQVTVSRDWQNISVSLDNQTSWPIHSAFYIDRQRYVYLGHAAPGERVETSFPAYQYMVASDSLSSEWLANSVASIAGRRNPRLNRRQLDGLAYVVHHALTPVGQSLDVPWGAPIVVAIIEKPTRPPLMQDVWATGYHYLVFPAGRD
jgi:hypothetical protein